jgi:hypothetical protein
MERMLSYSEYFSEVAFQYQFKVVFGHIVTFLF